jgi:hypothetical protein
MHVSAVPTQRRNARPVVGCDCVYARALRARTRREVCGKRRDLINTVPTLRVEIFENRTLDIEMLPTSHDVTRRRARAPASRTMATPFAFVLGGQTFHGVRRSRARRNRATNRVAGRFVNANASSDKSDNADGDTESQFSLLTSLAKRVAQIKQDERSGTQTMQVIVLDATLPGQVLGLRFQKGDIKRNLNAGTALGPLVEVGDTFLMLGQAPQSGQVLPMGTEVTVSRVGIFPDGSGDVEIELVGTRRVRVEGQPFNENGVAVAKTRVMDWAPESPGSVGDATDGVLGGEFDMIKGAHPAARRERVGLDLNGVSGAVDDAADASGKTADNSSLTREIKTRAENLGGLVSEWKRLVIDGGHERRTGQLDLIGTHLGPMPPVDEPARRAVWVAGLINPIPALGVAYEIRPALLMARDTLGMLKVATDGIEGSIERLRPKRREM